ncbi:MAG: VWA domain-containing protein [Pirellulaceae bacterium]|nr:VWA domain-containing protein [Pirellulaceae bacterium]
MFNFHFEAPYFLLLLLLLPMFWVLGYRSLSRLGPDRTWVVVGMRSLVFLFVVLALAETQSDKKTDRLTVIYLLDQSDSIPRAHRFAMRQYVMEEVRRHRNDVRGDRAGVIVFGRSAAVEIPPFDDDIYYLDNLESFVNFRSDATNLEGALKLAQAAFSDDTAKRVVLISDGNETVGSSLTMAQTMSSKGIAFDVVPIELNYENEIELEKLSLPSDVRKGEPFEAKIILSNYSRNGPVGGNLRVKRIANGQEELVSDEAITLDQGKNVLKIRNTIDRVGSYTYRAEFTPDNRKEDTLTKNNEATAFTHIRGKGRVLLIENWETIGEFDFLVSRLRRMNLEVDLMPSNQLFSNLAELQSYDTVVLANVPRTSGDDAAGATSFTDDQISTLVRNTQQMGCGLLMIGGPQSFGAGGWTNTELEKAMPVDFKIKNKKTEAVGALAMIMHACELPQGNYWEKITAREALRALGPMDYCGVLEFNYNINSNTMTRWLWGGNFGLARVGENKKQMLSLINRMVPGDMPDFSPSMTMGFQSLSQVKASMKHMIIISDGDPSPPSATLLQQYKGAGIKISTVAIGTHTQDDSRTLKTIANVTGGNYYYVNNAQKLPLIFQREARRVTRSLIKEIPAGATPVVTSSHEILQGIDSLPPFHGFVMTTVKENPLVEVSMISPVPGEEQNSTLLASWTYGLGRAAVITTDGGYRWTKDWASDEGKYDQLFGQAVRWTMRPVAEEGNYLVHSSYQNGKVVATVTALDQDENYVNSLDMSSTIITPDLQSSPFEMRQVAPGRYVGEYPAEQSGNYFINIIPEPGNAQSPQLRSGVSVPFSAEYRVQQTNRSYLENIRNNVPEGGEAGELIEGDLAEDGFASLLKIDTFRHNLTQAISSKDIWPLLLVLAATTFLGDVLVRRVHVELSSLGRLFSRKEKEGSSTYMEDLQSTKTAATQEKGSRYTIDPDAEASLSSAGKEERVPPSGRRGSKRSTKEEHPKIAPEKKEESYAERLMRAKREAFKDKDNER